MTSETPRTDAFREQDSFLESWREEWELAISFAKKLEIEINQFRDAAKMVPTVAKSAKHPTLQPCPFCGATEDDSEIIEPTTDCFEPSLSLHTWEHGDNHRTYLVQCSRCECNGPPSYDHNEALNLWNTRK